MLVVEVPAPIYLPPSKTPRSKGVHVSSIIRGLAVDAGILKDEFAEELKLVDVRAITDRVALVRINIGLAWEEHYIPMLPEVVDHPGEMCVDGIYMTHDGESVSTIYHTKTTDLIVHEVKATYKSVNTVGSFTTQSTWMWRAQVMAYCHGLGTRFAKMHVLYLCGDYTWPMVPRLYQYELQFTQKEIDENWDLLTAYRDERMSQSVKIP